MNPDKSHLYHRAHFLDILIDRLPKHAANLGKRLQSYTQGGSGPIELKFVDGTSATCDVLVGCDGIKSVVRRYMFQQMAEEGRSEMLQYIEPVWTGEITYRALVPAERLPVRDGKTHPALLKTMIVSDLNGNSQISAHRLLQYCGVNKVENPTLLNIYIALQSRSIASAIQLQRERSRISEQWSPILRPKVPSGIGPGSKKAHRKNLLLILQVGKSRFKTSSRYAYLGVQRPQIELEDW